MAVLDTRTADTWPKALLLNRDRFSPEQKAMRYKHYGIWQTYSWQDYASQAKYLALGLLSLGFAPGSKLLIVGDNSPVWFFAQLAAQSNRGIAVGLYSDLSAPEIEYVAGNCAADFAIVEDEEQADKLDLIRESLPALKAVVFWRYKGMSERDSEDVIGLREVLEMGRRYEEAHPQLYEENVAAGQPDDVCSIIYTSGTCGERPRGALHSYRSLMADSRRFCELDRLSPRDDLAAYLPPAWITEQWLVIGAHLLSGCTVNFAESAETQLEDTRETAPSVVVYSSRVWESLAAQVQARLRGAPRFKRMVTNRLLPAGYKMADVKYGQGKAGWPTRVTALLAERLLFRPIRGSLGLPRARVCYSSGATLAEATLRFFHALNVPLKNVYGSTEAGAVTGAADRIQVPGTVGSVNPGVELAFSEGNEIAVRHEGAFLGYHNDPAATALVVRDGWVYTGDLGRLENDEQLIFVERAQDVLTLTPGIQVCPQDIESRLRCSPFIKDAWVTAGGGYDSLSAVIVVDAVSVGRWADERKVAYTTFRDLSQKPEVYELIGSEIASVNQDLPSGQRLKKYVNLHKEFDPDESELTRNRKLRRGSLTRSYGDLLEALSEDRDSVELDAQITYQDGRTGHVKTTLKVATLEQER